MIYSYEEAYNACIKYFEGDEFAAKIFLKKYALKDREGNILEKTPTETHKRLAKEFARIEANYKNGLSEQEIFELLDNFKYVIPGGSPISGIGNNYQIQSLSNCYVIGNDEDSYSSIMLIDEEQVHIMRRRGGVGHDLSHLRSNGSPTTCAANTSTGIVPFAERYSNTTREVAQDGRRGALMLSLDIRHPDAENFIDSKLENGKITGANISLKVSDDFINKAIKNEKFTQQFPIVSDNPKIKKDISAKKLWDKIIHNAWKSAEPGVLFWDRILEESSARGYGKSYEEVSTNPCLTGDMVVAVADGRNGVTIKELSEEGKDVNVYTINDNGELDIRLLRNPRITGYNEPILKIKLDDGSIIRSTYNHKFLLRNGEYIEAKDLKVGSSLRILTKYQERIDTVLKLKDSKNSIYNWLNFDKSTVAEHRFIYEKINNVKLERDKVIHHIDYDSLNNRLDNLISLTFKEHSDIHKKDMLGDKNPIFKIKKDSDKFKIYSEKMSEATSGFKNGNACNISKEKLIGLGILLTLNVGRRFSREEWENLCIEFNIPSNIVTKFRGFKDFSEFNIFCAKKCKIKFYESSTKLQKVFKEAVDNGYESKILNNEVLVKRKCEYCGEYFWVKYVCREQSFCTQICAIKKIRLRMDDKLLRNKSAKKTGELNKENQLKIYSELKFKLKRDPFLKEFNEECKKNNIVVNINTKYGFGTYGKLKECAENYNHKVVSIEFDGYENVYNGTVDDYHNFFIGGFKSKTKSGKDKYVYINNLQCGEIPMPPYSSCILLSINLYSFVENPFTEKAYFNFDKFKVISRKAFRLIDDIVDLEIEKIQKILEKINSDPEDEITKLREIGVWNKILNKIKESRRVGLGVTAEGDMIAALNMRYGTKEATNFQEKVHKELAIQAYTESINLAKERGMFGIWDFKKDVESNFIRRIFDELPVEVANDYRFYGRRNIGLLTIAPTGTISLMTQTTSGIEPAFLISYKRRRKIQPEDINSRVDFIDENGDKWEESNIFHHKFIDWYYNSYFNSDIFNKKFLTIQECKEYLEKLDQESLKSIIEKSPYYKATSNDIDWLEKVRAQGLVQKWIDHSISVTVNVPKDTTIETVDEIYKEAWRNGAKGCTIYRDGSRSGVLVTNEENNGILPEDRPKTVDCDINHISYKGIKYVVLVGVINDKPYEIFAFESELDRKYKKGKLIKVKSRTYDLEVDGDGIICNIAGEFDNPLEGSLTRQISLNLKNSKIEDTYLQLQKEGSISDYNRILARTLKKYLPNDVELKDNCPDCGGKLHMVEGCVTCSCGYSKCG